MRLFILLSFISLSAWSQAKPSFYQFGKAIVAFKQLNGFTVNRDCNSEQCMAIKKAQEHYSTPLSNELLVGGKNPNSVRCKHLMHGKVIIGLDMDGNEQSFCHFSDGSYLK